jgi:hypothetical protein
MQNFVVVWDPDGELPEGKVFVSDQRYFAAVRRGVILLPVAEGGRNALSPWAKYAFGDGPEANAAIPSYIGRGALWLARGRAAVGWAALLRFPRGEKPEGQFRLVGDGSQPPLVQAPTQDDPTNRAVLSSPAHEGETHVVLQGRTGCQTAMDGAYAFALHGYARGARLSWLALSQTP